MHEEIDVLSVWELAHRWYDLNPDTSDPSALSIEVQDLLRLITMRLRDHQLVLATSNGFEFKHRGNAPSFKEYRHGDEQDQQRSRIEQLRLYNQFLDNWGRRHEEQVQGLEVCYQQRSYDRDRLDAIYLTRWTTEEFCREERLEAPRFWFPDGASIATATDPTRAKLQAAGSKGGHKKAEFYKPLMNKVTDLADTKFADFSTSKAAEAIYAQLHDETASILTTEDPIERFEKWIRKHRKQQDST